MSTSPSRQIQKPSVLNMADLWDHLHTVVSQDQRLFDTAEQEVLWVERDRMLEPSEYQEPSEQEALRPSLI